MGVPPVAGRSGGRRFVRQFALTSGRVHSYGVDLPLDTIVARSATPPPGPPPSPEAAQILALCARPLSIAEISAHLGVHLGIARVLVSDLVQLGRVAVTTGVTDDDGPDLATLERLLDDLQQL